MLVDAQQAHPFAAIWGDGHISSSDGQFFPAGGRGEASLEYNAKYGKRPGASIYGFLSNRFASFFSRMIQASESEAPYVLDGLLHNESSVEIHEHATDTAGATETTFSMFHAFGYRLIPRIRNLGNRRLFVIDPDPAYEPLHALIAGSVNMDVIEQHWDEILRLKASIGAGLVPPSVILKKLAASPRQNRLNQAMREMGRIERSIFICDWLLDTKLRRRSHAILNKGESRHALARAVFLHQLGELRNRIAETMAYRASGLNLVINAIILWNTVYLSRAVDYVRGQGIVIPDELLSQVAPLPWVHIALTGDYLAQIPRPEIAEHDPPALVVEQAHAQPRLELADVARDRGVVDVNGLRRPPPAAQPADITKAGRAVSETGTMILALPYKSGKPSVFSCSRSLSRPDG